MEGYYRDVYADMQELIKVERRLLNLHKSNNAIANDLFREAINRIRAARFWSWIKRILNDSTVLRVEEKVLVMDDCEAANYRLVFKTKFWISIYQHFQELKVYNICRGCNASVPVPLRRTIRKTSWYFAPQDLANKNVMLYSFSKGTCWIQQGIFCFAVICDDCLQRIQELFAQQHDKLRLCHDALYQAGWFPRDVIGIVLGFCEPLKLFSTPN